MSDLSDAFAKEFARILKVHKLTKTSAAGLLGVSRQAFHSYLNGKAIPRPRIQAKAAELWSIGFTVRDASFDSSAFGEVTDIQPPAEQMKLNLLAKLDSIQDGDLHIGVKRVGSTLNVSVRIDIPA